MPTYCYTCFSCGKENEVFKKMADPNPTECKYCGSEGLAKSVTAPIAIKGSGGGWCGSGGTNNRGTKS